MSAFWFARTRDIVPNHLLELRADGRSLECRKLEMLPIECVVRGYLAGSGWRDYRETGAVCGHVLPDGLRESERLPSPIFTPSTKALEGHDENIGEEEAAALCGEELYRAAKAASLALYEFGSRHAEERGIILADTKFELGIDADGVLTLGDEALTPDSSRFWPRDGYEPGSAQPSFDKQFARDWCEESGWDKSAAGPRASRRRGRGHARPLRRSLRAADRGAVRPVRGRSGGGAHVRATVLVRPKQGILDPQGEAIEGSLRKLGFDVAQVRVGRVIDLELDAEGPNHARMQVERMCSELLANPLIESVQIRLDGE